MYVPTLSVRIVYVCISPLPSICHMQIIFCPQCCDHYNNNIELQAGTKQVLIMHVLALK